MNTKIIYNEEALKEFIEWLPELNEDEKYYFSLQARKKYSEKIHHKDKTQLKRGVSNKLRLLEKIKQLECRTDGYTDYQGNPIDSSALALYITPNPRSLSRATALAAKSLIDMLADDNKKYNPHSEILSCIHKSKSKTRFVCFDIDNPGHMNGDDFIKSVSINLANIVPHDAASIIRTRGGCHILVSPDKVVENRNWYAEIKNRLPCDQSGDLMVPVVGCTQGNYIPCFY